jgi:catechol 2,3-dioxygenase-like lactoylglutathione lyase family enzyme
MAQNTKRPEKLKGPHHFTGITANVATNVDFWCRVLGLRFVKNTLNFETMFRYHTYFGHEEGHPDAQAFENPLPGHAERACTAAPETASASWTNR